MATMTTEEQMAGMIPALATDLREKMEQLNEATRLARWASEVELLELDLALIVARDAVVRLCDARRLAGARAA